MPFDRWRWPRPRLPHRVTADPRYLRLRDRVPYLSYEGTAAYVTGAFVVLFVALAVALVLLLSGGSKHKPAANDLTRSSRTGADLTTAQPASGRSGIPGLKPMIVRGSVLPEPGAAQAPLQNPTVLIAVEGGGCRDYSVVPTSGAFTVTLPGGCAVDGARVHFMAGGDDAATGTNRPPQAVCVTTSGAPSPSVPYAAGASVEVQLRPGCASENASLTFAPPQLEPAGTGTGAALAEMAATVAPGFPGGIYIDRRAAVLALEPGFPAGIRAGSAPILPPATAAPSAASGPQAAAALPGAIPTPPPLAGVPSPAGASPPGAATSPGAVPPAASANPAAGAFPAGAASVPASPPVAAVPPSPPTFIPPTTFTPPTTAAPPTGTGATIPSPPLPSPAQPSAGIPSQPSAAPPGITTPPVFIPPTTLPTGPSTATNADGSANGAPQVADGSNATLANAQQMTLVVGLIDRQGTPLSAPRVQALADGVVCADETTADISAATVQINLPGACTNLSAGSTISFRAAALNAKSGPTGDPAPACANEGGPAGVDQAVAFQPGISNQQLSLVLAGTRPPAGCPPDTVASDGAMSLSITVRGADAPELLSAPAVRVYVAGKPCAEGRSSSSIVAHVLLPADCGRPGDPLSFEAGAPQIAQSACSFELGFQPGTGSGLEPTPIYQPIQFAAGGRSVALLLGALPDCPGTPEQATRPTASASMTLRVSVLDPAQPAAPLARPTVTALVGGAPCVRGSSVDTQDILLSLPRACGADGAAISFRVSAADPRSPAGEVDACPVDLPSPTATAATFRPVPRAASFKPGTSASYALLPGTLPCAGASATPAPAAAAPPSQSPAAAASPSPSAIQPAATPSTATATVPATPPLTATVTPVAPPTAALTAAPQADVTPTATPAAPAVTTPAPAAVLAPLQPPLGQPAPITPSPAASATPLPAASATPVPGPQPQDRTGPVLIPR